MAHDVFISYATSDKAIADAVCSQLESIHRIRCWIAPRDVTPGASWAESIIDALDSAKVMVLIFSSNANASAQIEREVERAVHKGVNIIPLRIENTQPTKTLEYFISAPHWLDALSVPLEQHIGRLAVAVKALLSKPGTSGVAAVAPANGVSPVHGPSPVMNAGDGPEDDAPAGPSPLKWIIAVGIAAIVLMAIMFGRQSGVPEETTASTAAGDAPAVVEPAPAPPDAPTVASDAVTADTSPATPPAASSSQPSVAAPPRARSAGRDTMGIDFRNSVSEGLIMVEVDGQRVWSELLGEGVAPAAAATLPEGVLPTGAGVPEGPVSATLSVPRGAAKATVTLFGREAEVRDTRSIDLPALVPQTARTLEIRLSRFRKDVQLRLVHAPDGATAAGSTN